MVWWLYPAFAQRELEGESGQPLCASHHFMQALTSQVQGSTAIVPDWRRSLPYTGELALPKHP